MRISQKCSEVKNYIECQAHNLKVVGENPALATHTFCATSHEYINKTYIIMRRASRRKYHFIYKTTCIITNKFYCGMHSTDNLDDGYLGSGRKLWYSINKHGKENHKIEILEFLETREELKNKEAEIVNENLLNDPLCMNLKLGGEGGGKFWSDEHRQKCCHAGALKSLEIRRNRHIDKLKNDPLYKEKWISSLLNSNNRGFSGKTHSEETKQKMRKPHKTYKKRKNKTQV